MNINDKKTLDKLLPSVADKTITNKNMKIYTDILNREWDRISLLKNQLIKYYPFARY